MPTIQDIPDIDEPVTSARLRRRAAAGPTTTPSIPLVHPSELPPSTTQPLIPPSPTGSESPLRELSPTPSEIDEVLRQGGVIPKKPEDVERERDIWDEIFDTAILTIPFSFLYLMLDILVYMQYGFRPKVADIVAHMARAIPTLGLITWYTSKYSSHPATNPLLMTASLFAGCRLIWLLNKASWGVVTAQAPAMGAMWTLTIVQLPLDRAVLCLLGVAGWSWFTGMKIAT